MATMTQNTKPAPDGGSEAPRSSNVFDRFNEGLSENPRKYALWTVALFAVVLVAIFGTNYFRQSSAEEEDAAYVAVLRAGGSWSESIYSGVQIDTSRTSAEMLAALGDIESEVQETPYAPYYYWLVSRAAYRAAEEEDDAAEKLALFIRARDACETLTSVYSDTPWVKTPWKSSANPQTVHPSLVVRRKSYCDAQIKFLEENKDKVKAEPVADEGVTVTLTLKDANDPAAEEKILKIQVFSEAAPYAVAQLKANIDSGYWKGRHVYGLQENDDNTASIDAVLLGSALSLSPWGWEKHGGEEDWVQCTLPMEPNRLNPDRGTVAFELHRDQASIAGASPTKLVIHTSDHARPRAGQGRVVFGKVVDSDDALTWLENREPVKDKRLSTPPSAGVNYAPTRTLVISNFEFEGTPKVAPPAPLDLSHWKDPEQPEKPKEEEKQPEDKGGDDKNKDEKNKDGNK